MEGTEKKPEEPHEGRKLSDMDHDEAQGWVVERFNYIEWQISMAVTSYFKPANPNEFESVLMNNAILNIGSKVKVLNNIPTFDKNIAAQISRLASIRNAFAHSRVKYMIHVTLNKEEHSTRMETYIDVMNSNGVIKKKDFHEYLVEFYHLHHEVKDYLHNYNNKHSISN